jgi:uncharacterized protein (TIGR02996 family)
MSEERFLKAILASPGDTSLRLVYADWLADRGDLRAAFVRDGGNPADFDPAWVAFMRTLARPFGPYHFEYGSDELAFVWRTGLRGHVVTFDGQFRKPADYDAGLLADLRLLCGRDWGTCAYGSSAPAMSPFLCELSAKRRPLFASDVLAALRPRAFQSQHVPTLDTAAIPYPGYHPGQNDEIHTDYSEQYLFSKSHEDAGDGTGAIDEFDGNHGALKRHVAGGQLWYVLLHAGERPRCYVTLLAVGASPHGDRLVGVLTHQNCHNLCD